MKKFGNMGYIEVYEGILRYETGIYPTIPNFIYSHFSFISNGFLNWGDGVYTILHKQRFKLLYSLVHRIVGHMDITIHHGLDADMLEQLLQDIGRVSPFSEMRKRVNKVSNIISH